MKNQAARLWYLNSSFPKEKGLLVMKKMINKITNFWYKELSGWINDIQDKWEQQFLCV